MKRIIMFMTIIALPLCGFAQHYTLDELIEVGLEKSYDIQAEKVNELDAGSSLRSSYYGLLPTLSAGYERAKYFDAADPQWNEGASLYLSKTISLNDPSYYNIYTAVNNLKNARYSLVERRQKIAYHVFSSYLSILQTQETLEIQRKNLELQEKIHQQIKLQYDSGNKSILDLKQSEVSLIDYEIAVNEAENALSSTRKNLFSYLNLQDDGYEFLTPEIAIGITDQDFSSNLPLEKQANLLKNSKINLLQTRMNLLPTLSIGYNLSHSDPNDVLDLPNYNRVNNSVFISASWNIFGLLDRYESYTSNKRTHKLLELSYQNSEKEYSIQLENLQNDFKTLQKSYELYEEKLKLSQENLNMAQEQYRLGMISLLELDDKKLEFQNTQLAKIQRYYQLLKKQEEINLLMSEKILGKW